jgi:tetratricopeptide (TPR) repeat protein
MRGQGTAGVALLLLFSGAAWAGTPPAAHAMPRVPATVAEWAQGARLFEGLGDFHRQATTVSPIAQQYFDQGMRFLWAFNHDEATRSFARAAELDPACAACYWGVALTVGPNYNLAAVEDPRARVAVEALQRAQDNAAHASAVEQGLIAALATRYPASPPPDAANLEPAARAYAAAMRELAQRFPQDLDVQTLCAEAGMNVHAWKLWTADGQPAEGTPEIEARLESVLARDPNHPGANHYYIHVMEASPHPEKALAAAERLGGMMPAAGHLGHMPAHILQRVGRYEEAAEANRHGVRADRVYLAAVSPPDYYAMYFAHNYAFLAYSAAMEGRKAETLSAVQDAVQTVPLSMELAMGGSGWGLTQQYAALVRFGLWDELIALAPPAPSSPGLSAGYLYGRGVALAARGRLEEARAALAELRSLGAGVPEKQHLLHDVLAVAEPIVAARIAASEGQDGEAITSLEAAVAAEDRLPYNEPSDWFFPARHLLGAQLLIAGRPAEAERVYRADLERNPRNGWALYGLAAALRAQGRTGEAMRVTREFGAAWQHADVRLVASAFWFAGPDTFSFECQRTASGDRQTGRELLGAQHEARVD